MCMCSAYIHINKQYCSLAAVAVTLASYPGHVVGERCFSPITWPGYEATVT